MPTPLASPFNKDTSQPPSLPSRSTNILFKTQRAHSNPIPTPSTQRLEGAFLPSKPSTYAPRPNHHRTDQRKQTTPQTSAHSGTFSRFLSPCFPSSFFLLQYHSNPFLHRRPKPSGHPNPPSHLTPTYPSARPLPMISRPQASRIMGPSTDLPPRHQRDALAYYSPPNSHPIPSPSTRGPNTGA